MKKVLFIVVFVLLGIGNVRAQETTYGVTAGFHNLRISVSGGGVSLSEHASGYFVGFFADFNVSEKLNIQPEVHFSSVFKNGESTNDIIIPVMAKYYVSEKFNVQAGPQFDILVSESDEFNQFGLGVGLGAGYDFSEKIFTSVRYAIGLSNRIEDAPSGISSKLNTFQIGLGYRF
jgi:opacity protein-like surface antigen